MSKPRDTSKGHNGDHRSAEGKPGSSADQTPAGKLERDLDELENAYRKILDQPEALHRAGHALDRQMAESAAQPFSPHEQPPDLIDQAVQNMARRAVEAPESRSRRSRFWVGAFATFSLAVIAFSLILQQDPRQDLQLPPVDGISVNRDRAPADSSADDPDSPSRQLYDSTSTDSLDNSAATAELEERSMMKQSSEPESVTVAKERVDRLSEARQESTAVKSDSLPTEEDSIQASREGAPAETLSSTASQPRDQAANEAQEKFSVRSFRDQPAVDRENPDSWLDYISQLKATGQSAQAQQELGDFRQAFPDYPLPDEFATRD